LTDVPRIVDAVFGRPTPETRRKLAGAAAVSTALHSILLGWAVMRSAEKRREEEEPDIAAVVDIGPRAPDPPPPTPPPPEPDHQDDHSPASHPARVAPPPPAQAARILARAAHDGEPVDMTGAFVVGEGDVYAGGTTTSEGTSHRAVPAPETSAPAATTAPRPTGPDRSRPVTLPETEWSCPWPPEAEDLDVDDAAAVIRVVVRADGHVESATLVSDPGSGFGRAAIACALRTRFDPARDREGRAIPAPSPSIRVRFVR